MLLFSTAAIWSAQSQVFRKGDRLFGGSFSFAFYNSNNGNPNNYNSGNAGLAPSFGWAVKDNLVMGLKGGVGYGRSESNVSSTERRIVSTLSVSPGIFLRKYRELKNRFGLYFNHDVTANYAYSRDKSSLTNTVYQSDARGIAYNFNPGVFYKFSENFIGEANIGGVYATYTSTGQTKVYGTGVSFLQYFNVGFNYRIPRKS